MINAWREAAETVLGCATLGAWCAVVMPVVNATLALSDDTEKTSPLRVAALVAGWCVALAAALVLTRWFVLFSEGR